MELRHLRYFLAVAEELHFTRAAERLGIEQSPLSRHIRDLEGQLGARLFHRQRRHVSLTTAGEHFRCDVRRLLIDLHASVASVRSLARGAAPFRLGVAEAAAAPALARLLRLCRESDPPIAIQLVELPLTDLSVMVESGALEAALTLSIPSGGGLKCHVTWRDPFDLLVPPDHPMSRQSVGRWADLTAETWVLPDPVSLRGLAIQVEALLATHSISVTEVRRAAHAATVMSLVASGAGVALLPTLLCQPAVDVVRLPLEGPGADAATYLIYREDDHSALLKRVRVHAAAAGQRPAES